MQELTISFHLAYIFWRKLFVKGDYLALSLILIGLSFSLIGIYQTYTTNHYFLLLFLANTFFHHFDRKDFSLLQNHSHWRQIIFGEYVINNLPVLLIFILKEDFLYVIFYTFALIFCAYLPQKTFKMHYPFTLFNPFWHTVFRKYRLFLLFPLLFFLIVIAKQYNNENLAIFTLIVNALIGCLPYFERECQAHINVSYFRGKRYLYQQIKIAFYNHLWNSSLLILLATLLFSWELLIYGVFFFGIVVMSLLTKYAFFENIITQSIVFVMIISTFSYAPPLLVLPFLYIKSVKNIKQIQYVTH